MSRINWKEFITIDPEVHHGEPCIKGTRVPVSILVGSIADGMSMEEVTLEYPQITVEAVRAALAYAAEVLRHETLVPLAE
ncbi:MAG: DUF433 domain-containing protein [Anaerolineales bacterium]